MKTKSESIDHWRSYFRATNADVFEIIEHAIVVAAFDFPDEFGLRRDRIAEVLFTCRMGRCLGDGGCKVVCSGGDGDGLEMNDNQITDEEAEALTAEIEKANETFEEILRIKDILNKNQEQSVSTLCECLRKLQLMDVTFSILEETKIGMAVSGLRKHSVKEIRTLARSLVVVWKALVDEWTIATKDIAAKNVETKVIEEFTPDSTNPSVLDEEEGLVGLASPPMDTAFFTIEPLSLDISELFAGLDDEGNLLNNNCGKGRKPTSGNTNVTIRKQQSPNETNDLTKNNSQQTKKQEANVKPSKPSNYSGPGRSPKLNVQQKSGKDSIPQRPPSTQQTKRKCPDDAAAVQEKLEASTRKLHERYQQAENAKRQRTTQFMDFSGLPKQGTKRGNPNKTRVTVRR